MNTKLLSLLNLLGLILTLTVNGLANALPINGYDTGQLSDMYPNLFVPAGFTFSIWGVIYLWLIVLVVYGLVTAFSQKDNNDQWVAQIGPWFLIQSMFNIAWIFAWHYRLVGLSLLIMLGILTSLIMIYTKLKIGEEPASAPVKYVVHAAISLYLGWITIATVANVTTLLVDMGFQGGGIPEWIWTAIVLAVATGITLAMQLRKGDFIHSLVALWALFGIYSKRQADIDPITALLMIIGVLAALILGAGVWQWVQQGLYRSKRLA